MVTMHPPRIYLWPRITSNIVSTDTFRQTITAALSLVSIPHHRPNAVGFRCLTGSA